MTAVQVTSGMSVYSLKQGTHHCVRNSNGDIYVLALSDGGSVTIWKSNDNGKNWTHMDSGAEPSGSLVAPSMVIDGSNIISVVYQDTSIPEVKAAYFNTTTDTWTTTGDTVASMFDVTNIGTSLSIDANGYLHVAYMDTVMGSGTVYYVNNMAGMGTWGTPLEVAGISLGYDTRTVCICISSNNQVPCIITTDAAFFNILAYEGDANDPTSFTEYVAYSSASEDVVATQHAIWSDNNKQINIGYADNEGSYINQYIQPGDDWTGPGWNSPTTQISVMNGGVRMGIEGPGFSGGFDAADNVSIYIAVNGSSSGIYYVLGASALTDAYTGTAYRVDVKWQTSFNNQKTGWFTIDYVFDDNAGNVFFDSIIIYRPGSLLPLMGVGD